ncbi:hypothetical protein Tco_0013552, partial [Tanacetum coccineum]
LVPQLSSAIDYRRLPSLVTEKLYFPIADGCSTREGNAYKLWYFRTRITINGVRVILASRLRYKVLHVDRRSERIMSISLVVDEETVNVIVRLRPTLVKLFLHEGDCQFDYLRDCEGFLLLQILTTVGGSQEERIRAEERYKDGFTMTASLLSEKKQGDIRSIRYIKDEGGQSIVNEEEIRKRWGEQYSSIFN